MTDERTDAGWTARKLGYYWQAVGPERETRDEAREDFPRPAALVNVDRGVTGEGQEMTDAELREHAARMGGRLPPTSGVRCSDGERQALYWYARAHGVRLMGPFVDEVSAWEACRGLDGLPVLDTIVWPSRTTIIIQAPPSTPTGSETE